MNAPNPQELLIHDYDQAWQHLRHVESMRVQYVSFYFTVMLGSIALSYPILSRAPASSTSLLLTASGFAGVLVMFSSLSYLVVCRIGTQLRHYRRTISLIRTASYAGTLSAEVTRHFVAESSALNAQRNQRAQEYVILLLSLASAVVETALVVNTFQIGLWMSAASGLILVLSLAPLFSAARVALQRRKLPSITIEASQQS